MARTARRRPSAGRGLDATSAGAAGTVLTPSGLAAIVTALLTAVEAGDHLLVIDSAYQPTRHYCDGR